MTTSSASQAVVAFVEQKDSAAGTIAIEQSRYSPSLETAFQIARVFGVRLDQVFRYLEE